MSDIETFDIFNHKMVKIGTDTRENVHAKGLWHQTFHCWIINSTDKEVRLLFQLRDKNKDSFPGLLDISCAGHLLTGETVENGVRELKEELGIAVSFEHLVYCGMTAQETFITENFIDKEFNHVFLMESNKKLEEYSFQIEEISGLYFVNLKEFKKLLHGTLDAIMIGGIVLDETTKQIIPNKQLLSRNDFTPNSDEYYQLLFDKIESMYE